MRGRGALCKRRNSSVSGCGAVSYTHLSDLAPCFAKIYTVTPNCPRALSAEELQKEARFHTDAEAADSVADAIRKAVDYADENNLAGVVVCGSLYLAPRPARCFSKKQKNNRPSPFQQNTHP